MVSVGVVIAAGGAGRRFGGRIPKQFLKLDGISVLERSIRAFDDIRLVNEIIVASQKNHIRMVERLVARMGCRTIVGIVAGGKERQDSVRNGLHGFVSRPDIVLVHDAARPLVSRKDVRAVIAGAIAHGAAVVGARPSDTIKMEGKKGFSGRTLDRGTLWAVQTPQGFRFELLMKAQDAARRAGYLGTDEASLVERLGVPVLVVNGDQSNIKVTTRQDMRIAEMWLAGG